MRRILLVGRNGQIGWELQRSLSPLGEVVAVDIDVMDLSVPDSIRRLARETRPDIIVNAGGYTAVERAESEAELARAVNSAAPGVLAEEALRLNALLVHYSSDFVFDGEKNGPYDESDTPSPVNFYGRTKLEGEREIQASGCAHLIFRTSWIYGNRGKNFLKTIIRLASERDELRVVDDQVGAPTWSRSVADGTAQVLARCHEAGEPGLSGMQACGGIYGMTSGGSVSRHGFAVAILKELSRRSGQSEKGQRLTRRVIPISSGEYRSKVRRPSNSVMSNQKLHDVFGIILPDWRAALGLCLDDLYTEPESPSL
jgi:dTDP-4-dehydrorhamnose reductase